MLLLSLYVDNLWFVIIILSCSCLLRNVPRVRDMRETFYVRIRETPDGEYPNASYRLSNVSRNIIRQ
jgi:hypothetical protein